MIYSWIWSKLRGGRVLKVVQVAALCCLVLTILFLVVFPEIDALFIEPPVVEQ